MKPKARQRRVRKLARNPDTRASIPLEYLRGFAGADELRAERRKNARLNSPVVPGSQMSVRDLAHEAASQTRVQYGPQERALAAQSQQVANTQAAIPGWFDQYRAAVAQLGQQTGQTYQNANQQIAALQAPTTADTGTDQAKLLQQALAVQGGQVDPAVTQQAQQAAAINNQLVAADGGVLAAQGASAQQRLGELGVNSYLGQNEELLRQAAVMQGILGDKQSLSREEGAFNQAARGDILDREQKSVLERAAFGLDTKKAKTDAALSRQKLRQDAQDKAAARRADRRKEAQTVNQWGFANKEWRSKTEADRQRIIRQQKRAGMKPGSTGARTGAKDKPTAGERQKARQGVNNTVAVAQYVKDLQTGPNRQRDRQGIIRHAQQAHPDDIGSPGNRVLLDAAIDLVAHGHIRPKSRRRLKAAGIDPDKVEKAWGG